MTLVGAASIALALAACGSPTETAKTTAPSVAEVATTSATPTAGCPTAAPADAGTPEWTLPGATGSVAVTGSTDTHWLPKERLERPPYTPKLRVLAPPPGLKW